MRGEHYLFKGNRYPKPKYKSYPWINWIAQKTVTIRRGRDFICSCEVMRKNIHQYRSRYRKDLKVRLYINLIEESITIYFSKRNST